MSARRLAIVAAALVLGLAAGVAVGQPPAEGRMQAPAAAPAPVAPAAAPAPMPTEAPVRSIKQARLDHCERQTWPYITTECLERVADRSVRPAVAAARAKDTVTVTTASRDAATRTTTLVKTPVMKTASR